MTNFADFQLEIYMKGLQGIRPGLLVTYAELERRAHSALDPTLVSYVAGGAGDERTQDANVTVFDRWGLIPRMLVGAAERDLSVAFCGMTLPTPIFMAPVGVIGLCAQDGHGDLATARAAAATGIPMVASTLTVDPLEDVAVQFGDTPGLFQLYTPNDRELAESFVRRAETAGFKALVVTLDTWTLGWRPRDVAVASFPLLAGHCLANYTSDEVFRAQLSAPPEQDMRAAALHWAGLFGNPTLSWADLPWLRSLTSLPLILKAICHPDDVRRRRSRAVRLRRANRRSHHQGACPGGDRRRDRAPVRVGPGARRSGRHRACAAMPARRGGPVDGGRRLSDAGSPRSRGVAAIGLGGEPRRRH